MTDDTVERIAKAIAASHFSPAVILEDGWFESLSNVVRNTAINQARAALSAMPQQEVTVKDAAKVLLSDATIAEKVEMNHAGVVAMFPGGWDISQKIAFDKGRIAALRAISEGE